jgi:hypothetical protein
MATPLQLEQPLVEKLIEELQGKVPEYMDPGTIISMQKPLASGVEKNPLVAALSCPRCGFMACITHRQLSCKEHMICGSDTCSAEYRLEGKNIVFRRTQ